MDAYTSFLANRKKMERAIGRYVVELTEKGHRLPYFTQLTGIAVQQEHHGDTRAAHAAIIKGSDRDLVSAVRFCGVSAKRKSAAIAALYA